MRLPLTYLVDTWFKNEFGLHVIFFSGNGTAGWPDDVDPETIVVRFVLCAASKRGVFFFFFCARSFRTNIFRTETRLSNFNFQQRIVPTA